jgi:hypothetical protein
MLPVPVAVPPNGVLNFLNTGVMDSNPIRGIYVCLRYSVMGRPV